MKQLSLLLFVFALLVAPAALAGPAPKVGDGSPVGAVSCEEVGSIYIDRESGGSLWVCSRIGGVSDSKWIELSSSGGAPSGAATGDLTGTYPSPTVDFEASAGEALGVETLVSPTDPHVAILDDPTTLTNGEIVVYDNTMNALVGAGVAALSDSGDPYTQAADCLAKGQSYTDTSNGFLWRCIDETSDDWESLIGQARFDWSAHEGGVVVLNDVMPRTGATNNGNSLLFTVDGPSATSCGQRHQSTYPVDVAKIQVREFACSPSGISTIDAGDSITFTLQTCDSTASSSIWTGKSVTIDDTTLLGGVETLAIHEKLPANTTAIRPYVSAITDTGSDMQGTFKCWLTISEF